MLNLTDLTTIIEKKLLSGEFELIGKTLGGEPLATTTLASAGTSAHVVGADTKTKHEDELAEKISELNPIRFAIWKSVSFLLPPSDPRFSFTKTIPKFGNLPVFSALSKRSVSNSQLEPLVFGISRADAILFDSKISEENKRLVEQDPARFAFTQAPDFLKDEARMCLIKGMLPEERLLQNVHNNNSLAQIKEWKSRLLSLINDCLIEHFKRQGNVNSQAALQITVKIVWEVFIPAFKIAFTKIANAECEKYLRDNAALTHESVEKLKASIPSSVSLATNLLLGIFIEQEIRLEMSTNLIKIIERKLLSGEFELIGKTLGGEPLATTTLASAGTSAHVVGADTKTKHEDELAEKISELNPIRFAIWKSVSFLLPPSDPRFSFTKTIPKFGNLPVFSALMKTIRSNYPLETFVFGISRADAILLDSNISEENKRLAEQDPARFAFTQAPDFLSDDSRMCLIKSMTPEERLLQNVHNNSLAQIKKWKSRLLSLINDCLIEHFKRQGNVDSQIALQITVKIVWEVFIPAFKIAFTKIANTECDKHLRDNAALTHESVERLKASIPSSVSLATNLLLGIFIEQDIRLEMGIEIALSHFQKQHLKHELLIMMRQEVQEYNKSADQRKQVFFEIGTVARISNSEQEANIQLLISYAYQELYKQTFNVRTMEMHWVIHCMRHGGTQKSLEPRVKIECISLAKHLKLAIHPQTYSSEDLQCLRNQMLKFYSENPDKTLSADKQKQAQTHLLSMFNHHTKQLEVLKRNMEMNNRMEANSTTKSQKGKMLFLMECFTAKAKKLSLSSVQTIFVSNPLFDSNLVGEIFGMLEKASVENSANLTNVGGSHLAAAGAGAGALGVSAKYRNT